MLYFAYGSNLNHEQMHERCKDSKYLENFFLEGYNLFFCAINSNHGVANIIKKPASIVPGGVWEISTSDEKELDYYEGFPKKYTKDFFEFKGKKRFLHNFFQHLFLSFHSQKQKSIQKINDTADL